MITEWPPMRGLVGVDRPQRAVVEHDVVLVPSGVEYVGDAERRI
jgi:hypothetical protein